MSTPPHRPTEADLTDDARARLDRAYGERSRRQCSREDFAEGYLAALVDAGGWAFMNPVAARTGTVDPIDVVRRTS